MLYSCEFSLSSFIQTDRGLLIQRNLHFISNFVMPFYKSFLAIPLAGLLLDLANSHSELSSLSQLSKGCAYFPITLPMNSRHTYSYPKKTYASPYSRNSCSEFKKRRATLDFDEIVPVVEEALPQNNDINSRPRDVLILDPSLLETIPRKRVKIPLTDSEQNKIARITITYILSFFALVLTTYFIIYLA